MTEMKGFGMTPIKTANELHLQKSILTLSKS